MTAILPTTRMGVYRVIEHVRTNSDGTKVYLAECSNCHERREVPAVTLRQARNKNFEHCLSCKDTSSVLRVSTKICAVCCNMPWVRPLNRPCRCGEWYAPERIERPSIQRSSAGFAMDNCASSYRVGVRL